MLGSTNTGEPASTNEVVTRYGILVFLFFFGGMTLWMLGNVLITPAHKFLIVCRFRRLKLDTYRKKIDICCFFHVAITGSEETSWKPRITSGENISAAENAGLTQ